VHDPARERIRGTLAIDVGGTFTDVTFADAATGATWVAKTPSTPADLALGFITAIRKVLALANRQGEDILRVFHGTTTATNAILEGKTPPTALLTTAGFKYVLEIGRHDIPRHGNLYGWSKPTRPITPDRVFEVTERLDANGTVLTPLAEDEARTVARQLAELGIPSVAVVFLHAYANPIHERRAQAILTEEYPGVLVSLSSEVLPQFREFERTMATALNAAVMPHRTDRDRCQPCPGSLAGGPPGGRDPARRGGRARGPRGTRCPSAGTRCRGGSGRRGRDHRQRHGARHSHRLGGARHDPRRFTLVAFGGAGPLHACRLAELLDIPTVVVPPRPGVLSTWGLLDTDIRATFVRTVGRRAREATAAGGDLAMLETAWIELEHQARQWLEGEQVPPDRHRFEPASTSISLPPGRNESGATPPPPSSTAVPASRTWRPDGAGPGRHRPASGKRRDSVHANARLRGRLSAHRSSRAPPLRHLGRLGRHDGQRLRPARKTFDAAGAPQRPPWRCQ
jgi:hypothetical protein